MLAASTLVLPQAEVEGDRGDGASTSEHLEVERVQLELARVHYVTSP